MKVLFLGQQECILRSKTRWLTISFIKPNNFRPCILRAKQMKVKDSRRIIGTFSEVGNLIRSITQLLYDHVRDTQNPYRRWLILIRHYLQYIRMPKISQTQVNFEKYRTRAIISRGLYFNPFFTASYFRAAYTARVANISFYLFDQRRGPFAYKIQTT